MVPLDTDAAKFLRCWAVTQELERGDRVHRLNDGAGLTRWGVTERWFPAAWQGGPPSLGRATDVGYYLWRAMKADRLPFPVSMVVFDWGFNDGHLEGVQGLQRVVGVAQDGDVGPVTLGATVRRPGISVASAVCALRIQLVTARRGQYAEGLVNRVQRLGDFMRLMA
jgi:lysozyme family protein